MHLVKYAHRASSYKSEMIRTLRNELCRLFVAIMCLLAGVALSSNSVRAQETHGARKPTEQHGIASQKEFKFEVVSIRPLKPGAPGVTTLKPTPTGYHARMSVGYLIMAAYVPGLFADWKNTPLLNAPKWIYDWYEINARVSNEDLEAWQHQGPNRELLRSALRAVLKERCKLVIHMQPKEVPVYWLVSAKKGPKLMVNAVDPKLTPYDRLPGGGYFAVTQSEGRRMSELYFHAATMQDLCNFLSVGSRFPPIHDRTGLTGRYDFKLRSFDHSSDFQDGVTPFQLDPLGLELKPGKEQGFSIVIDQVEKPDAN